jgi:hypothetical protein
VEAENFGKVILWVINKKSPVANGIKSKRGYLIKKILV